MNKILILILLFTFKSIYSQSTENNFITNYSDSACECIGKINIGNRTKEKINTEVKECINSQVSMYQLTSKLSNIADQLEVSENDNKVEKDTTDTNKIDIIIDTNEESTGYKSYYYELERYLMDNCEDIKSVLASDNQESPVSISNKKLAKKYYNQGIKYYQKQNFKKSIIFNKKAIKEDPNFAFAWDNLGISYRMLGDYKKAIYAYEKSLEIDPYGTMPLQNIAVAYQYENEFEKAIVAYEKLGGIYKNNPEVYFGIGKIYAVNLKDYEKGLNNMCKAYNIYVETSSPYRADAEKIISFISGEMSSKGDQEIFNRILAENKINVQE